MLTEDHVPPHHRLIYGMFGQAGGVWIDRVGRRTTEKGRHSIMLRDLPTVTRNLDPVALPGSRS